MRELVGLNFARLREERCLTQEQVEERSGYSQWYISSLERGRRNPTVITLFELATALGVKVADLIDETAAADLPLPKRGPGRSKTGKQASGKPR